jgi:hypothetical protein
MRQHACEPRCPRWVGISGIPTPRPVPDFHIRPHSRRERGSETPARPRGGDSESLSTNTANAVRFGILAVFRSATTTLPPDTAPVWLAGQALMPDQPISGCLSGWLWGIPHKLLQIDREQRHHRLYALHRQAPVDALSQLMKRLRVPENRLDCRHPHP